MKEFCEEKKITFGTFKFVCKVKWKKKQKQKQKQVCFQ